MRRDRSAGRPTTGVSSSVGSDVRLALHDSRTEAPPVAERAAVEVEVGRSVDATVHRGGAVDAALARWGIAAATVGRRILLPELTDAAVLRHELAHVVQNDNREPDADREFVLGRPDAAEERAAADPARVVRGSDPQVVRGVFDNYRSPVEIELARREAERRREERERAEATTAAWRAAVAGQAPADLAGLAPRLEEDVLLSEAAVLTARRQLLDKVSAHLPTDFAATWATARTALELLRSALQPEPGSAPGELSEDLQEFVRGPLLAFYWPLRSWETKRHTDAVGMAHRYLMVWKANQLPLAGTRFANLRPPPEAMPPPPPGVTVRARREAVELARNPMDWTRVLDEFAESTKLVDQWAGELLAADAPERQALDLAIGLHARQVKLQSERAYAIKIPAVFYPKDETRTEDVRTRAVGYPWFFYLYREPGQAATWVLEDLTAPDKRVNVEDQTLRENIESALRSQQGLTERVDPPERLWEQLNSKLRFPKGVLHLRLPSTSVYRLETTADTPLSEYLGYAAIGAGVVAVTLFTAGAGTPAAIAVGASAALGIAGTAADLAEKEQQGMATGADRAQASLLIAVDLASVLTLGLGRIAASAVRAGSATSAASRLAGRLFVPAARLSMGLEATQLFVITTQFVDQFHAIANQPDLSPEQRTEAQRKLVLVALGTGALSLWSIRSTAADIRNRTVTVDELLPPVRPTVRPRVDGPPAPDIAPPVAATDLRLGKAKLVEGAQLVENLAPGTIAVELRRNRLGLVSEIAVVHGPPASGRMGSTWAADMKHHQQVAVLAQRYSGLIGELRELLKRLASVLTGRRRGPLERELDIAKLEGRIEDRLRRLQRRGLRTEEIAAHRKDIESFANQIEGHRQAILRGDGPTGRIFQQGTPVGHPVAPPGYHYHYDSVRQRWDIRPDQPTAGPRFDVVRDASGLPTGRVSNVEHIDDLGVVGQPIANPATTAHLAAAGYKVEGSGANIVVRTAEAVPAAQQALMVPLRVVDGKVSITPVVHLDVSTLGSAAYYRRFFGKTLNAEEMAAMHRGFRSETQWVKVGPSVGRGGDETLLHRASEYGLVDYIRYHIVGPGTGAERTRIFLAPERANQFANNHIEGFMRRIVATPGNTAKVYFRARYSTFSGPDLRSFIDAMLTSGDQRIIKRLVRDQGRFERILKDVEYEIRVVDLNGTETWYRASISIGPPGSGTVTATAPTVVPAPE